MNLNLLNRSLEGVISVGLSIPFLSPETPLPQISYIASMYWYSPSNPLPGGGPPPVCHITCYKKQVGKEFESVEMLWSQFEGVMGSGAGGEVGTADVEKVAADVTMGDAGEADDEVEEDEEGEKVRNR